MACFVHPLSPLGTQELLAMLLPPLMPLTIMLRPGRPLHTLGLLRQALSLDQYSILVHLVAVPITRVLYLLVPA